MSFIGAGTVLNVSTVAAGALIGIAVGHRLPHRTVSVVTDALGLTTLLMAGLSCVAVVSPALTSQVGSSAMLIVLGSVLIGGIIGSLLRIEERLGNIAGALQSRLSRVPEVAAEEDEPTGSSAARERFIEGWLAATLLFCIGPLAILGSLDDGMGRGIDKIALKSVLDGFAAIAFASTFGIGVLLAAVSVGVVQGSLTLLGVLLGSILPEAHIAALTATGGLLLAGIGLRLLEIKKVPVGDMLPALILRG